MYNIKCDCNLSSLSISDRALGTGYCHCDDCRELLNVPYHSVAVWKPEHIEIKSGKEVIREFKHPKLRMTRVYCSQCGEMLYNTNNRGMKLISQLLIKKNYQTIPAELAPRMHFFYGRRIIDIDDNLPKYE